MYAVDVPTNPGAVFWTECQRLHNINDFHKTLKQQAAAQESVQELESELYRLRENNSEAASLRGVVGNSQA